jgi:hypothetical protein
MRLRAAQAILSLDPDTTSIKLGRATSLSVLAVPDTRSPADIPDKIGWRRIFRNVLRVAVKLMDAGKSVLPDRQLVQADTMSPRHPGIRSMRPTPSSSSKACVAVAVLMLACGVPFAVGVAGLVGQPARHMPGEWVPAARLDMLPADGVPRKIPIFVPQRLSTFAACLPWKNWISSARKCPTPVSGVSSNCENSPS